MEKKFNFLINQYYPQYFRNATYRNDILDAYFPGMDLQFRVDHSANMQLLNPGKPSGIYRGKWYFDHTSPFLINCINFQKAY